MTVLTAPPGGSIPGPSIVCNGCGGPAAIGDHGLPLPFCPGCAAALGMPMPDDGYPEPDYARVACLAAGCLWFAETRMGDEDGLRFRAECHARETGHAVGYWWHTDDLRDMGDDPDEVIP